MAVVLNPGKSNCNEIRNKVGLCVCGCKFIPHMWEVKDNKSSCPECGTQNILFSEVTTPRLMSYDKNINKFIGICTKCQSNIEYEYEQVRILPVNEYGSQLVIIKCPSCNTSNNYYEKFDKSIKTKTISLKLQYENLRSPENLRSTHRIMFDLESIVQKIPTSGLVIKHSLSLPTKFCRLKTYT